MSINSSPDAIGERIKKLRNIYGEHQRDLAKAINSTQNNVSKMEVGNSQTLSNLINIAKHYNVSLDFLCLGKEGINFFDTLSKYIHFDIKKISRTDGATHFIPYVELNNSLYKCLRQLALAKCNSEMPEEIQKIWIKDSINKFIESTNSSDDDTFVSFIPLMETILENSEIVKIIEEHIV